MENNVSPLIDEQVPEHLRGVSPLFVGFVETYYKFVEQRTGSVGLVQNRALDADIDLTQESYVSEFYDTYGEFLPQDMALDRRNFIKLLNTVYESKGTEKSLKLLFRAIFNENIDITYPSEQILKTSDGVWELEKFVTLTTQFGGNQTGNIKLFFTNSFGDYYIDVIKIVQITPNTARFYFKSFSKIDIIDDQLMFTYNDIGEILFAGKVTKSPAKLTISSAGTSWQVGQVIVINGIDGNNTIARVTSIDNVGGIKKLEILEYGIHEQNQTITVSPYPNKPYGSNLNITKTLVSINPNVFSHTITIHDYTDGVYDSIMGFSDMQNDGSYFLNDYTSVGYTGQVVIAQSFSVVSSVVSTRDAGITIEQWLASRSTIVYEYDNVVITKGYFKNESGQLSNQFMKNQDNYYYQAFSYVINTKRDIREYRELLNITHPAGTKRFSNLEKQVDYSFDFNFARTMSHDTSYLRDIIALTDDSINLFTKKLTDSTTNSDTRYSIFGKSLTDFTTNSETRYTVFDKSLSDSIVGIDVSQLGFGKSLTDFTTNSDTRYKTLGKGLSDITTNTDIKLFSLDKYRTDTVSAISLDVTNTVTSSYTTGTYFSETYASLDHQLTIG